MLDKIIFRLHSAHVTYWQGWIPRDVSYYDVIFTDKACYIFNRDDAKAVSMGLQSQLGFLGEWIANRVMAKHIKKNQELQQLSLEERMARDRHAHKIYYHEIRKLRRRNWILSPVHRIILEMDKKRFKIVIHKDQIEPIFKFMQEKSPANFTG